MAYWPGPFVPRSVLCLIIIVLVLVLFVPCRAMIFFLNDFNASKTYNHLRFAHINVMCCAPKIVARLITVFVACRSHYNHAMPVPTLLN